MLVFEVPPCFLLSLFLLESEGHPRQLALALARPLPSKSRLLLHTHLGHSPPLESPLYFLNVPPHLEYHSDLLRVSMRYDFLIGPVGVGVDILLLMYGHWNN
jgi:hypothetical protein